MSYTFDISAKDKSARKESLRWILNHISKNKFKFLFMIITTLAVIALRTIIPFFIGILVDKVIEPREKTLVKPYALLILGLGITRILLQSMNIIVTNSISAGAVKDIREEFFETIQAKPLRFHNRTLSGDLMALATNDMRQLGSLLNPGLRMLAEAFVGLFTVVLLAISINPVFTLLLTPFFILYIISIFHYNKQMEPISATFMSKWSHISRSAQDSIIGVRVVRAFNGEDYEIRQFRDVVMDFKKAWYKRQMIQAKYWPLFYIYVTIGISFVGSTWAVINGYMSIGELVSLNGMLLLLIQPTFIISFAIAMAQSGLAGGERIFHTMYSYDPEEDKKREYIPWPEHVNGDIEFRDVSFKYEGNDKYILSDINLKVSAGQTVALVGPTGSGKTSLTKLLSRFYKYEGQILLDGVDIQKYRLRDLRRHFGRVEQDIFLFASSIRDNITFGITNGEIKEFNIEYAAKAAQAHEFIMEMEEGYDTKLGERGVGLSGGQKQRIAIARCVLTNPPVMILDDSTSAIDSETEEKIARAMDKVMENRTTFLITHRLSAIRKADLIAVFKDGKIKETGTHDKLLKSSKDYRRIFGKHLIIQEVK